MLESMTVNPRPTRAEASDVANAICDGTDAVMLSGETAVGRYPVAAVTMMDRIAHEAEAGFHPPVIARSWSSQAHAVTHAACSLATEVRARAMVVFTHSGTSAHLVSQWRPPVPVYAYTCEEATYRGLALWWGLQPVLLPFREHTDAMLATVTADLLRRGSVRDGDSIVFVGSAPLLVRGRTNFVKLQTVSKRT
jgi:pyruvate kinase